MALSFSGDADAEEWDMVHPSSLTGSGSTHDREGIFFSVRRPTTTFAENLPMLTRRSILSATSLLGLAAITSSTPVQATTAQAATVQAAVAAITKVSHTEAEWRALLSPEQFDVLRREGTEHPFTSALNHEKRRGTFVCVACDLPLFASSTKFDSGTGWPSFFRSLPGAFEYKQDRALFLARTEYHCTRCGGHHGHVFDDGPPPTGKRYCNNGVGL